MHYRLLAMDLDGTAIVDGQMPTAAVQQAVAAAQARGVQVVVATGRPYNSARRYAAALGVTAPVICFQGAVVKELTGAQATLWADPLPEGPLAELITFAETRHLDLTLYSERAIYIAVMYQPESFYEQWFGLTLRRVQRLSDALAEIRGEGLVPLKALFIGEPAANDRLFVELRERFADRRSSSKDGTSSSEDRLAIVRSHALFVEATSPRASKGNALAFIARHLGISQAETIAIGDSGNDLSMVEWAGLGVAMANASPETLAAADWVAPSVDEDGVVAVIERFILNAE